MARENASMTSSEIEKISHISYLKGPQAKFIENHGVAIVQSGRTIFVYDKDCRRLGTLKLPDVCKCHQLVSAQGLCFVFCGLRNGRIISCSLQQWCHQRKKKHKSKSKVKGKSEKERESKDETQLQHPKEEERGRHDDKEEDIFGDLLGGGDYGLSWMGGADNDDDSDAGPAVQMQDFLQAVGSVITVGEDDALLHTKDLEGFTVVNDNLVTCCRDDIGWRVSIHQCCIDHSSSATISCDQTPVYSTVLFGINQGMANSYSEPQNGTSISGMSDKLELRQMENSAGVYVVVSGSSHGARMQLMLQSSDTLVTSNALFASLWGAETNLADSPVVLITLPDGCVYSIPFKNYHHHPSITMPTASQAVKLLYHSLQPVIQVCTVSLTDRSDPVQSGLDSLVLVGAGGHLVTFHTDPSDSSSAVTKTHYLVGPVNAASSLKDSLVSAFSCDLKTLIFVLKDSDLQLNIQTHLLPGVSTLTLLKATAQNNKLLAVKNNGTVLQVIMKKDHMTTSSQSNMSPAAAGVRMKELLYNMKEISSKMAAITTATNIQSSLLEELSKAHHVCRSVQETADAFEISARVEGTCENGHRRVYVVCDVRNSTQWTLSQGWMILGSVSCNSNQGPSVMDGAVHTSRSIPLSHFLPQTTMRMSFTINENQTLVFPMTIQCWLSFDPKVFSNQRTQGEDVCGMESSVILANEHPRVMFWIGSSVLDILDTLQKPAPTALRNDNSSSLPHSARSHRTNVSGLTDGRRNNQGYDWSTQTPNREFPVFEDTSYRQPAKASSVTVALDNTLLSSLNGDNAVSPAIKLLQILLPSNLLPEVKGPCIEAMSLEEKLVSIQVVEAQNAGTIEVRLTSQEERITRRLVEAVHRRIKSSKLLSASYEVDLARVIKQANATKTHLERHLDLSDQAAAEGPGEGEVDGRQRLTDMTAKMLQLHTSMRSQIVFH